MNLAAIFCIWGDANGMIDKSIDNILPCVDGCIVIFSNTSNFGDTRPVIIKSRDGVTLYRVEPLHDLRPHENETRKRNYGLDIAREYGYTHFIMLDFDEFYHQSELLSDKERVEREDLNGLVHPLKVLFKEPTLWCEDHTLCAGIQKITPDLKLGSFKHYPFAYDSHGNAHIDPTRRPSHRDKVAMSDHYMIHASWIRSDFDVKINNSAARENLKKSTIYADLAAAAPGVYNNFYRQTLQECPNYFNLPSF